MKRYRVAALCFVAMNLMAQRAPVNLGSAGNYVILTETGITDVPPSVIVGNVGASPITGAAIHLTCTEVTGTISAVDAAGPAPCALQVPQLLGPAILDMQAAYADAAGRTVPDFTELGAGNISGMTLAPGLYKWSTGVMVDNTGVTLSGGPNAVWIFQIAGDVLLANNAHVTLAGGASANNVFWQVGGPTSVTIGTGAVFSGNLLSAKQVIMNTGATLNGRAYAFTQVTLQSTGVTNPGLLVNGIPVPLAPTVTSTTPANLATGVPIGSGVSATFSEAMNPATITPSTFTLQAGLTPVAGSVTYANGTATFTPTGGLVPGTVYTGTITTGAADPQGVPLAVNYVWNFTTRPAPMVTSTVPANGATNIALGSGLAANFSTAMNPATISTSTFTLMQGATVVAGTVNYSGLTATFIPSANLAPNMAFTATITTGAQDLLGYPLAGNYSWTFATRAVPTVSSTVPASGATNVAVGSSLAATFSTAMNPLSVNTSTFTLRQGASVVAGTVGYAGVTATFIPAASLAPNLPFTATITTGAQDPSGTALAANYVWTFTTGATPDTTPPTVSSTVPASGATNVAVGSALAATFSKAINPLTINTSTFTVRQGATVVPGTVGYAGVTATFTPSANLAPNLPFTATITTGVQDLSGNALAANYVWTFTTGSAPNTTPPTVSSTVPASGATNVSVSSALAATFSEAINPLTINTTTFTLRQGATAVPGTVGYAGLTATFTPSASLAPNLPFTATISTGVQDLSGNALASSYVWTFTTGSAPNTTPPTVSSTVPGSGATNVSLSSALAATFSEAINPLTMSTATFTLRQGATAVSGTVSYAGVTATFTPLASLAPNLPFTATISTGVQDLSGNALASNYVWTFTTGSAPNTTPPTVSSTVPASGATNVAVGGALAATFSEAINPLTINTTTFTLRQGATAVSGTVGYAGVTATFTPLANLSPNALFTATITTGVQDLSGNALASNYVWTFTTGAATNTTPPTVSSTVPASGATSVALGSALAATFSEAMNPLTISTATFTLRQGASVVAGTVGYAGVTAFFTPLANLAPNLPFTATITTGVQDLSGNALASNYVFTFATGTTPSTTPPVIISALPGSGATNVGPGSGLAATFSEAINPLTINTSTFTLRQGATVIPGAVSYAGVTATFTPLVNLSPNLPFTATISTGVQDLSGNALAANYVWTFTTGSAPLPTLPTVISTLPSSGAQLVTVSANMVANFSEPMNPLTINNQSFTVTQGGSAVAGTVTYAGTSATFRPANFLLPNTLYEGIVSTQASDLTGNSLATNYLWNFTTSASTANQTSVCLANFAVLSGSAIIGTGSNAITGDIGVSPGTAVTGFPPGTLTGTIHAGDTAAAQAIVGFTAAYADAVSRAVGAVPVSGDLGGQTFTAGLYNSASSLVISSGNLTLDAKGDPNAVFIFQAASTLTTAAGRQIVLAGGAQAFNVFWQVGTAATLGSNSVFNGSILSNQTITLNAGVTVNGRLLALNGAVTLQSDVVTSPSPGISAGGIVNAASESRTVAAGSIAAIFGNQLAASLTAATAYPLLTALGGSSFQIGTLAAPLFMTSCSQANVQIPWEEAGQTQVPVTATVGGLVSAQQPATIAPFAPGIFSMNMSGSGQGAVEIAPTTLLAAPAGTLGRPVMRGEYIAIFCTGLGPVTNQPATGAAASSSPLSYTTTLPIVTIGGASAQVTYSGLAPGFAGLYQVNAVIPGSAPSGSGVSLALSMGGVLSNTVTIAIQ